MSGVLRRPAAPATWLNELKRLTSVRQSLARRQFWDSLPWVTKVFTVVSLLDALYIFALSVEQLVVVRSGLPASLPPRSWPPWQDAASCSILRLACCRVETWSMSC